jgi:uncharacterized protein (TIGR02246 family)
MQDDEQAIRELVSTWMEATRSGDADKVLSLIADDAVFLIAGRPVMTKADFAKGIRAQASGEAPRFDGHSEIQEIRVLGEWAYMWTRLKVVATPPQGEPVTRAGHTLSVLRKEGGRWLMARDANLLTEVPPEKKA